ncbi:MAG: hypothetical protein LC737_09425, partial [Chloroflexi bacterium]|nr:hypothetical protein [Chloroflexota bacterium]
SMSKHRAITRADGRTHGRHYSVLFGVGALVLIVFFGFQFFAQAHPNAQWADTSDTDVSSLRAAETGQLGEPALVLFHADW